MAQKKDPKGVARGEGMERVVGGRRKSERAREREQEGDGRTVVDNGMMDETGPLGAKVVFFSPCQCPFCRSSYRLFGC